MIFPKFDTHEAAQWLVDHPDETTRAFPLFLSLIEAAGDAWWHDQTELAA